MKANMPKCYAQLKPSEKARIEQAIFDRLDEELCDAQIIWIKMACSILHDMGLSKDDVTMFIGNWKPLMLLQICFPNFKFKQGNRSREREVANDE